MIRYIVRIFCILLLICSLTLLIMPSWLINGVSVSAAEYVLKPAEHKDLTKEFSKMMDSRKLTTRVSLPVFILLLGNSFALGFSIVLFRKNSSLLLTSLTGGIGIVVYTTNILLKSGAFAVIGPILSGVMLVAGIFTYLRNY